MQALRGVALQRKCINVILVQHEKAATFLDILKSFFRPTLVRVCNTNTEICNKCNTELKRGLAKNFNIT